MSPKALDRALRRSESPLPAPDRAVRVPLRGSAPLSAGLTGLVGMFLSPFAMLLVSELPKDALVLIAMPLGAAVGAALGWLTRSPPRPGAGGGLRPRGHRARRSARSGPRPSPGRGSGRGSRAG